MNLAYIQHGEWGGPYQTVMADGVAIDSTCRPNPYASGYGAKSRQDIEFYTMGNGVGLTLPVIATLRVFGYISKG